MSAMLQNIAILLGVILFASAENTGEFHFAEKPAELCSVVPHSHGVCKDVLVFGALRGALNGRYTLGGECSGLPFYTCTNNVDSVESQVFYLYYSGFAWRIGWYHCDHPSSKSTAYLYTQHHAGSPVGSVGWFEDDKSTVEWSPNEMIDVRCVECTERGGAGEDSGPPPFGESLPVAALMLAGTTLACCVIAMMLRVSGYASSSAASKSVRRRLHRAGKKTHANAEQQRDAPTDGAPTAVASCAPVEQPPAALSTTTPTTSTAASSTATTKSPPTPAATTPTGTTPAPAPPDHDARELRAEVTAYLSESDARSQWADLMVAEESPTTSAMRVEITSYLREAEISLKWVDVLVAEEIDRNALMLLDDSQLEGLLPTGARVKLLAWRRRELAAQAPEPATVTASSTPTPSDSDSDDGRAYCVICIERRKDTMLEPCRHACVCRVCAVTLRLCPLCRTPCTGKLRVFI